MLGGSEKEVWEYWIKIGVVPFRRMGTVSGECCFARRQKGFSAGLILAVLHLAGDIDRYTSQGGYERLFVLEYANCCATIFRHQHRSL